MESGGPDAGSEASYESVASEGGCAPTPTGEERAVATSYNI